MLQCAGRRTLSASFVASEWSRVAFHVLAFGVAFEMPVAIVLLVWAGLVKLETPRGNRGYVILGIFIVAAILTPPDAVSQCMMAVPMYLLYEFGLVMARILAKAKIEQRKREEDEERAQEQAET